MNEPQIVSSISQLLQQAVDDDQARDLLYRSVYQDLRQSAQRMLSKRSRGELQTTALVNEVVMRIERSNCLKNLANRKMFFSVAATAMRQVLIDHYRRRQKSVEEHVPQVTLDDVLQYVEAQSNVSFEALAEELDRLEQESSRQHAVIMHRFFAGRTVAETAELLDVSEESVHRDWRLARAKLFARLKVD